SARRTRAFALGDDRQARGDRPAAAVVVDDVYAVMRPIRARDAQEERQPAPEAELPLLGERALEDELPSHHPVVLAPPLENTVHVDLDPPADGRRQLHPRLAGHAS